MLFTHCSYTNTNKNLIKLFFSCTNEELNLDITDLRIFVYELYVKYNTHFGQLYAKEPEEIKIKLN